MWYRIKRVDGIIVEGEKIETKGDDTNYPTFILRDGKIISVHKSRVLGEVNDDCSPHGLERPKGANHASDLC